MPGKPKKQPMWKVCANCKNHYIEGDKYCRFCGAKIGELEIIPKRIVYLYGPPMPRVHKCVKCGYEWDTYGTRDRQLYCPKCGGSAPPTPE